MSLPVSSVSTDTTPVESSFSAVSWSAIIAGAFAATVISLLMMLIGSGLGLTMISPFSEQNYSAVTIGSWTAIWFVLMQWLSSGIGGYLTGRLRTKWVGVHTNEVYFRDTAHGFLAWTLSTLLVAGVLGSVVSSVVGAGTQAVSAVASATGAAGAGVANVASANTPETNFSMSYFADSLMRPANPQATPANQSNEEASAQVARILATSATEDGISAEDRTYLNQLVASRAGLSEAEATSRIDATLQRIEAAKAKAAEVAETTRKAASRGALLGALSLLIGAFIASASASLAGKQRDDEADIITNVV